MTVILTASTDELSSLWAQWVGSVAAVASVAVAIVFGYLTLANTRRSKDAQERAAFAAADRGVESSGTSGSASAPAVRPPSSGTAFSVRAAGGERWELRNEGDDDVRVLQLAGLTALDARRLTYVGDESEPLAPGAALQFVLVSRLALAGPANVVVRYRLADDGPEFRQVLLVPAL